MVCEKSPGANQGFFIFSHNLNRREFLIVALVTLC